MAEEDDRDWRGRRSFSRSELEDIAEKAAAAALTQLFWRLGYNIENDQHVEVLQSALRWAGEQARVTTEDRAQARRTLIGSIISAIVGAAFSALALWAGLHGK